MCSSLIYYPISAIRYKKKSIEYDLNIQYLEPYFKEKLVQKIRMDNFKLASTYKS